MKRTIFAAVMLLIPLCACGDAWRSKPPGTRDDESYALLKAVLPTDFSGAPVVSEWRGFTDERDISGDGWVQCAVIVYDLKDAPVDAFVAKVRQNDQVDPSQTDYALRGWMLSDNLAATTQPNADNFVDHAVADTAKPDYPLLDEVHGFCGMPAALHDPLAAKAKAAWTKPGNLLLVRDLHYGGGVGGSGDRVEREVKGVVDTADRKFYTWLAVAPVNGLS